MFEHSCQLHLIYVVEWCDQNSKTNSKVLLKGFENIFKESLEKEFKTPLKTKQLLWVSKVCKCYWVGNIWTEKFGLGKLNWKGFEMLLEIDLKNVLWNKRKRKELPSLSPFSYLAQEAQLACLIFPPWPSSGPRARFPPLSFWAAMAEAQQCDGPAERWPFPSLSISLSSGPRKQGRLLLPPVRESD